MECGEWRVVPGIDADKLLVSSEGWIRVRTKSRGGIQALGLPQKGSLGDTGTRRTGVDGKTYLVHRLVALAFLGPAPSSSHTVDHLNRDPDDNRSSNLRWATKSEQSKNQCKRKVQRSARPVILTGPDGVRREYSSQWAAATAIGANPGNVSNAAKYGHRVNGHIAESKVTEPQEDLVVDGVLERWAVVPQYPKLRVSTMGRIQWQHYTGCMGFRTTPVANKRLGGYCFVHVGTTEDALVHRLVLETFSGPPADSAQSTVDHINHDRGDNKLSNLRWASAVQQRSNRSKSVIDPSDLLLAPANIELAKRKQHYKRASIDGVWLVRAVGKKRRWARAKCVVRETVGGV